MEGCTGYSQNVNIVSVGREDKAIICVDVDFLLSESTVLFQTDASPKIKARLRDSGLIWEITQLDEVLGREI